MPSTESLFRHYREGQQYFREKFGRPAVTAWAPDSFGHSAGIPDLLAANGFQYFSFMRPQKLELPDDLFRWSGPGGGTLLAYRLLSYTAERDVAPGLDRLAAYQTERNGRNIGIGFGLGDHGGGTTRRQIRETLAWAEAHPEVVPDLKKLMDYYLPMTVKLLNAYADMDAQPVQGETIQASKKEIEATLDTLNLAFEKLLDDLFRDSAMDVSSDISVLNTLLAQEGLTEDGLSQVKKQQTL